MAAPRHLFRKCFIAAPLGTDTSLLRSSLQAHGVEWSDLTTPHIGSSILATIEDGIRGADFVCVVLGVSDANVAFEMGLARGLGKPLLIFVGQNATLPEILLELHYVLVNAQSKEAIDYHLDAFLTHARASSAQREIRRVQPSRKKNKASEWARTKLEDLTRETPDAREIERVVVDAFREIHAVAATSSERNSNDLSRDDGADLAVWLDDVEDILTNPVLIQIKYFSAPARERLSNSVSILRSNLSRASAHTGLLIYWSPSAAEERAPNPEPTWPLVIPLSVADLLTAIREGRLSDELRNRRNAAVHGRP